MASSSRCRSATSRSISFAVARAVEIAARTLYQEGATYCHGVKDYVSRDLFESLMKDEEHHIDFLETQLDLIQRIGLELYTQKHVGGLESEH